MCPLAGTRGPDDGGLGPQLVAREGRGRNRALLLEGPPPLGVTPKVSVPGLEACLADVGTFMSGKAA